MVGDPTLTSSERDIRTQASREFSFTDDDFENLRVHAYERAGIELRDGKQELLYSRLVRRVRALKLPDFSAYSRYLDDSPQTEVQAFVNAITTNHSGFFRESHHFDFFGDWLRGPNSPSRPTIWSAGCSSGEESYSIAMVCDEVGCLREDMILSSDINTDVLKVAREGVYEFASVSGLSEERQRRHFLRGTGENIGFVRVKTRLQSAVRFEAANLFEALPQGDKLFDAIFCRNVIIYFGREKRRQLFRRLVDALRPGGYLFVGHSESLVDVVDLRACGRTTYRKVS